MRWLRRLCVFWFLPCAVLRADPTIWDGPTITYTQPAPDPTQAANQDRLTPNVWLTRNTTRGLLNAATETFFTDFSSPANTEWAFGELANFSSLAYSDWETWNGKNPPSMVGKDAVLHLISDNIYLSIEFTSWGGAGGGFSYARSTPILPGDLNQDEHVDSADIEAMELALTNESVYAQSKGLTTDQLTLFGDVNGDGKFTNADIQALIDSLQSGGGSIASVSEPATFVLLATALPSLLLASLSRPLRPGRLLPTN